MQAWGGKGWGSKGGGKIKVNIGEESLDVSQIQAGTNINLEFDETTRILTISSNDIVLTQDQVEDIVANLLIAGNNIDLVYDDDANILEVASTAADNQKDIVFMLGEDLSIGVQPCTEMLIPYQGTINNLLVTIGTDSTRSSNLIFSLQKYSIISGWSDAGTFELQVSNINDQFNTNISIDNHKLRIELISGDYMNVSNMSVIAQMDLS